MKNHALLPLTLALLVGGAAVAAPETLKNGAPYEGEIDASLPRELVVISFPGGAGQLPKDIQGLTEILSELFQEGPAGMTGDEYRKKLFLLNAEIDVRAGARSMALVIATPQENLEEVLNLSRDLMTAPHLDDATFATAKDRAVANAQTRFEDMREVVTYVSKRQAFDYHPDILDGAGSPKSLGNVTLAVLKEKLPLLFSLERAFFSAMGPAVPAEVKASLEETFVKDGTPAYKAYEFQPFDPAKYASPALQITIINRPGATDNQVLRMQPEPLRNDAPERAVADVTHEVMGGGLTGRLGDTLRTKRGLTYHASSRFARSQPYWIVYSFAGDEQLPPLLTGIPEVINAFKEEKLEGKEVLENIRKKVTAFKDENELPLERLMQRIHYRLYGWDPAFLEKFPDHLEAVTPADVEAFADKKISLEGGYLFLMGDKAKLEKALEKAGLPATGIKVVEVDQIL